MEPLKFKGVFKDYIWGGNKLNDIFDKRTGLEKTAESWELSTHPDGESIISGGKYDNISLSEYIRKNPEVLGTNRKSDELPVLIKLIDAKDNLSIQVHPDDEQARKWENQNGKTEMWYVIDADKDSEIVFGTNKNVSEAELKKAIEEASVMDILNSVKSKKGDVFFVEAGTIHAIGKGNLIAEIQQNSNVTYRLYDYDRKDKNGNKRELHIEKGVKASKTGKIEPKKMPALSDGSVLLASCEYFSVKKVAIKNVLSGECRKESYQAITVTDGNLNLTGCGFSEKIKAGETIFLPAGLGKYKLEGNGEFLMTENKPRYFIGIDLGGTNIAAAVVDEFGVIYGRSKRKTNAPRPYNEIFDDMVLCAKEAALSSGLDFDKDIENVGVGCPGSIDIETGNIEYSNNLEFYDAPITEYMEKALNKKVYVENDANAAAWGEFIAGSGKGTQNMIMITLGTGVGSGIIEKGRLLTGAYGKGAELGHTVICVGGEKCTCSRRGCFEAYASATALIRQTKKAMKENLDSKMWETAGKKLKNVDGRTAFETKNDATAKMVIKNYLTYLSEGIVDIVNTFQPEVLCLGGGISNAGERILKPINAAIKKYSYARHSKKHTKIEIASLKNDAGIIGAALLWKNV